MLIDTHATVKDLTAGGTFTDEQAEKITEAISRADDKVATKQDLELLEQRLRRLAWRAAFAGAGLSASLVAALLALFEFFA